MNSPHADPVLEMEAGSAHEAEATRRAALEEAVRAGQARSTQIRGVVTAALDVMSAAVAGVEVSKLEGQTEARHVAEQFGAVFDEASSDLTSLFARQHERLASFNVVLFGRTGAGKSSAITALVRGDGQGISPGQTDFTDRVLDERWGDDLLRVKDTPGTQGRRASELADIARREVEVADVVVLAFDDSSQLRGEFAEIATHVKALGKPAVAVLNVKERAWGDPDRCVDERHMRGVANTIRVHASHVREQLSDLGLNDVSIIAISAQRAVYARAAEAYVGPDAAQCQALRQRWGRALLLERSNFEVLDTLLEELATQDPAAMRTAMLARQATSVLDETADECDALSGRAAEVAETLEAPIRQLLELTGHPRHFEEATDNEHAELVETIEDLEALRGGGFGVGALGDAEVNARRCIAQHLGAAEQAVRARAAAEVAKAMQQGRRLSATEFRAKIIKKREVQNALDAATEQLGRYLERRVETIAIQLSSAMSELRLDDANVHGDAGRAADRLATGLSLTELAVPLAAIAATQFWNPSGWAAAAILAASVVGGWLTGKLAKVFRRKSRRSRDDEITRAIAEAERTIREAFAELRPRAASQLVHGCRAQLLPKLAALVAAARTLRQIVVAAEESAEGLREASADIPVAVGRPQDAVRGAQAATAERLGCADADLLLFERWLGAAKSAGGVSRRQARMPRVRVPRSFGRRIEASVVDEWVERWTANAPIDAATRRQTRRLRSHRNALPRVTVVGDYSTGKTSFLRRMHWELGAAPPRSLRVGAAPETDRVRRYPLGEIEFVDTPGHQSSRAGDTETAREAILGSACVLYLVGPSLLTGDVDLVDLVLGSLEPEGRLRLVERAFWVINRVDELPADPLEDPDTFLAVCEARRKEFKSQLDERPALQEAGLPIDPRRILCVASDPHGALGVRRSPTHAQLNAYSQWDGMASMLAMLDRLRPRLVRHATPAGRAEHAVRILWEGGERAADVADRHSLRRDKFDALAEACEAEMAAGAALSEKLKAEAADVARARVVDLIGTLRSSKDPAEDERRLRRWWEDKILHERLASWHVAAEEEVAAWRLAARSRVEALADSVEFRAAFSEHESTVRQFGAQEDVVKKTGQKAEGAAKAGAGWAKQMDHAKVLDVGHKLGHKFRPWEAKKLAGRFGKASKVAGRVALLIAVANAAYGLVTLGKQRTRDKKAEREFQEALAAVLEDVEAWVIEATTGVASDPGILLALDADISELRSAARAQRRYAQKEDSRHDAYTERANAHRCAIREGLIMLKRPVGTVGPWS